MLLCYLIDCIVSLPPQQSSSKQDNPTSHRCMNSQYIHLLYPAMQLLNMFTIAANSSCHFGVCLCLYMFDLFICICLYTFDLFVMILSSSCYLFVFLCLYTLYLFAMILSSSSYCIACLILNLFVCLLLLCQHFVII